jgi:replicative DNA helicase
VPRQEQVAELSTGLKLLAKELGVSVLAMAQLNRNAAHSRDGVPTMTDLRESGQIEADADKVWLLHRPDLIDPEGSAPGEFEVHVAKHRNGPTGQVSLLFNQRTTKFLDLEVYRD